jgi:hypothetical protein
MRTLLARRSVLVSVAKSLGATAVRTFLPAIAVLTTLAAQQLPSGPAPIVGPGAISGVVVDGTTNAPLAGVVVYLGPPNRMTINQPLSELTDEKGRFVSMNFGPLADGYPLFA